MAAEMGFYRASAQLNSWDKAMMDEAMEGEVGSLATSPAANLATRPLSLFKCPPALTCFHSTPTLGRRLLAWIWTLSQRPAV